MELPRERAQGLKVQDQAVLSAEDSCSKRHWCHSRVLRQEVEASAFAARDPEVATADAVVAAGTDPEVAAADAVVAAGTGPEVAAADAVAGMDPEVQTGQKVQQVPCFANSPSSVVEDTGLEMDQERERMTHRLVAVLVEVVVDRIEEELDNSFAVDLCRSFRRLQECWPYEMA